MWTNFEIFVLRLAEIKIAGSQNWDLGLKVFSCHNLLLSSFAIMDARLTSHSLLCANVNILFYSQILVYAYKKTTKIYLGVSERMTIFTSDRNDSPLQFTTIQVQSILQEIDRISEVWEIVRSFFGWVVSCIMITFPIMPVRGSCVCCSDFQTSNISACMKLIQYLKCMGCLNKNCEQGNRNWRDREDLISFSVERSTFLNC